MAPKAIGSASPCQTSSVTTLDDQERILAIEPDPYREKAFKIATELLTTERSYVAVLHLIDQVIVQVVYLSCLSIVMEVFVTVFPLLFSVLYFIDKLLCASLEFVSRLSIFFDTGWSSLVFKCYQKKKVCLKYSEESGLALLLIP